MPFSPNLQRLMSASLSLYARSFGLLVLIALVTLPAAAQDAAPRASSQAIGASDTFVFNDCGQASTRQKQSYLRQLYGGGDGLREEFNGERVQVEGTVLQYMERPTRTTDYYIIEDQYGVAMMVQTPSIDKPAIGARGCVDATIMFERSRPGREAQTYLAELPEAVRIFFRDGAGRQMDGTLLHPILRQNTFVSSGTAHPNTPDGSQDSGSGTADLTRSTVGLQASWWPYALLGGLLLAAVGLVMAMRRRSGSDLDQTRTMLSTGSNYPPAGRPPVAAAAPAGAPPSSIDALLAESVPVTDAGGTIKLYRPKDVGTVKVLPGRLKVASGLEGIPEIRFFMARGRSTTEITFGRSSGTPYEHVELTPRTVSAKQARLIFDGGQYTLVNLAARESNPTQINGREMAPEERVVLTDGDRIAMGEVEFVYSAT